MEGELGYTCILMKTLTLESPHESHMRVSPLEVRTQGEPIEVRNSLTQMHSNPIFGALLTPVQVQPVPTVYQ